MDDVDSVAGVADQGTPSHERSNTERENLVALRKKTELQEQQLLYQQQQIMELQRMQQQRHHVAQDTVEEAFDFSALEREEFPDGKNLAKAFGSINKKLSGYEKKLAEKDQKISLMETAMQYKDFADVVTPENIKKYIEGDEDLLEAVRTASNPGRRLYNLIKKSADYQADLSKKGPTQEQRRVEEKDSKPRTSSGGVRSEAVSVAAAMSNSRMTREQRAALWRETQAASRR